MIDFVVSYIESIDLIANRYRGAKCINRTESGGQIGCFSVVFAAHDTLTDEPVVLKFITPDVSKSIRYRRMAFYREPELLKMLIGQKRGLQLVSDGIQQIDYKIPSPHGEITQQLEYFVTEWVKYPVDELFMFQEKASALSKLQIAHEMICAIETLHAKGLQHRDFKPDNMRRICDSNRSVIKAIDLGAAARFDTIPIDETYDGPAGATAYSAPEARAGLAGERLIGSYTDIYSLGCQIFELFDADYFYFKQMNIRDFCDLIAAGAIAVKFVPRDQRLDAWHNFTSNRTIRQPTLSGPTCSAPNGIRPLLNNLIRGLTEFDYRKRTTDFNSMRRIIASAMKVVQHDQKMTQRQTQAKKRKPMRELASSFSGK